MNVRLVKSDRMDNAKGGKEHIYIRVPKRARRNFNTKGERLRLIFDKRETVLFIKQAYREDTSSLIKQINQGKITETEACITGFVSTRTYKNIIGRCRKDLNKRCFLSDSIEDIKIGADPEFALVCPTTKCFQYAQHIPHLPEAGPLGSDGPVAEVRPLPSTNVKEVVASIEKILHNDTAAITVYDWIAGAAYKSPNHPNERVVHMGGHIHLGNPVLLNETLKTAIYERIIRILDETIALPLVRIDGPFAYERRNKEYKGYGRYGRWGDQRPQPNRFEWRVPSGLWLAHPRLATIILSTTKALTETCLQMMAEEGFNSTWINAPDNKKGFLKAWGSMDACKAKNLINKANPEEISKALIIRSSKKLKGLSNYHKYKAEIDEFIQLVQIENPKFNLNLKDTWLGKGKMFLEGGK